MGSITRAWAYDAAIMVSSSGSWERLDTAVDVLVLLPRCSPGDRDRKKDTQHYGCRAPARDSPPFDALFSVNLILVPCAGVPGTRSSAQIVPP
jgi:hypothetical protein